MKKLIFFICIWLNITTGFAQQNATLYNMRSMYQRTYINPGLLPDAKIYIGIPVLGTQYINIANNRLDIKSLSNVFEKQSNDSFFLNVSKLSSLFGKRNYINLEYNMDLVHFGIKIGNNMFGVNSTLRTMSKLSYPGDIFKLILEGNGGQNLDKPFDFSLGLDMQQYMEFGIWYGREHSKNLTFGGRLKYIQGISNVWLEKGDIGFRTDPSDFSLNLTTNIKLNTASTMINPRDLANDSLIKNLPKGLLGFKNNGFGLDLGAQYYVTKRISVSASLIDLGWIKWNSNATTFSSRYPGATTTYNGVNFSSFFNDTSDFQTAVNHIADSLIERLGLDTTRGGYTRSLYTQFYVGSNFHLTKSHNAGILFYGNFHNKKLYPGLTLSWNSKLTRILSISASYTMVNNKFNNLGLGFTLNGGPFQFHLISDNIVNAFDTKSARLINLRFGMGFTIGRDKNEKK